MEDNEIWRRKREERCRDPSGWLSLVGLHFLAEGNQSVGGASDDDVRLEISSLSNISLGSIRVDGASKRVEFTPSKNLAFTVRIDGKDWTNGELTVLDWNESSPTLVQHGTLTWFIVKRGDRFAIRAKDSDSVVLREFKGIDMWPIDLAYRVQAKLVPHADGPIELRMPTAAGTVDIESSPGDLHFELAGEKLVLRPVSSGGRLQVVFADGTTNKETYGGGRFLICDLPADGSDTTVLDFNQSYNPPCVFTPWCTCPLPIAANKLKRRIEAGEKMYGDPHGDSH
jgi:uncharacterized protein (DUF1684 family)